ncbi:hypothetical protein [Tuwongella immobilis]|uniref:Uncharacterized protein n=1 Tax=Tuwongella immobilis TaxID=692036 RepID=A0A6C2YH16_9BACT|nr:hypothetical protein [Tuwongella immobilis]VIP00818.1 unnamed protein product [Tuwongella immobilis]VTR97054.1 unnamed protein product [Tuwongella immobilis]
MDFNAEIELLRNHLLQQGLFPIACVESGTVGRGDDESLVVHFSKHSPPLPGEEHLEYFDTPSTICVSLNLRTGKITIHEQM